MCGRYSIVLTNAGWRDRFDIAPPPKWQPVVNAAPGQLLPIITAVAPQKAIYAYWGFKPAWAAKSRELINARCETVAVKPLWRTAFKQRRVLVPADGFYEWATNSHQRQPYRIVRRDGQAMLLAGLAEPRADGRLGYAIITTSAADPVDTIHERSPVLIERAQVAQWLNPKTPLPAASALMRPVADGALRMYHVSRRLNNPRENDPALIKSLTGNE